MHSLPVFLRLEGRAVLLLGDAGVMAAKRRLLERAGARIVGAGEPAALAVAGPDEPAEAVEALRAAGVLVNAVDRPQLCDWTLPAIVERGPVLVAIGTGGVSAGLAAAIRQRLELLLPATLGGLAEALRDGRAALRRGFPDGGDRRRAIGAMLAPGGPLDPFRAEADPAGMLVGLLAAGDAGPAARLERVVVRSADPDELTLRAARLLGQADRLFHPSGLPPALLDRARADAERFEGIAPVPPPPGLSVQLEWVP